jgi:YfiH family protein
VTLEPAAASAPLLDQIPGLVHGFGRRGAGPVESREATERRLSATLEAGERLFLPRQVHGAHVVEAPWRESPEADAALTRRDGLFVAVRTADCLPVLVADPGRRLAVAAHAGWRGTVAGVCARSVESLVACGARAGDLVAVIGPGIGVCCYEVGSEVVDAFGGPDSALFEPGRQRHQLNLRLANRRQLERAGLRPDHVHDVDECTACRPELYHSFRRDGAASGRMISYIGWRRAS